MSNQWKTLCRLYITHYAVFYVTIVDPETHGGGCREDELSVTGCH